MKVKLISVALVSVLIAACSSDSRDNQPPRIDRIVDQTVSANMASLPISVSVTDELAGDVDVTAISSDTDVVADAGLALLGSGANRSLVVTPVQDVVGTTEITVFATDSAGLSASRSFSVQVDPEQKSIQLFTRQTFSEVADDEPDLVNAIEFLQDAENDDFADLLTQ